MKKMILIIGLVAATLFTGCSHKSAVEANLTVKQLQVEKLPYTIAIDGSKLKDSSIRQDWDGADLTVEYGNGLLDSIRYQLDNIYADVFVYSEKPDMDYDYKIMYHESINQDNQFKGCNYERNLHIIVNDKFNKEVYSETITNIFVHETPNSALVLGFITGLTMFIASPITMPSQAAIRGNQLNQDVSVSNDELSKVSAIVLSEKSVYVNKDNQ